MTHDVVIVGGGPNGLMLASELALAGVRPTVLEQLTEPAERPKANGLVGQIVRMLHYRGLYERFGGAAPGPTPVPYFQFGGLALDLRRLPDNPMFMLPVPQQRMEQLLAEHATSLGVDLRRGHQVTGLSQQDDGVTLQIHGPAGGYQLTASYVAGCDGGRSLVRRAVGIDFPGITDTRFISRNGIVTVPASHLAAGGEIQLPGQEPLRPFAFHRTATGMFAYGIFAAGSYRVSAMEWHRTGDEPEGPITVDELRAATGRVLGADLPMTTSDSSDTNGLWRRPGVNSRQADSYRAGRVFLVGDAAHVHSGVGGPGLNLGLQDAINLGWKLAAQIQGWAPPGLLDSYHRERHPLGARILMHTRAQMALLEPGDNITALRELLDELLRDTTNVGHLAALMTGTEAHYDTFADRLPGHDLIGRFVPDAALPTGQQPLRAVRPVLLDLTGNDLAGAVPDTAACRLDVVTARTSQPPPADAILIRPDGYVAWALGPGATATHVRASATTAIHTWFTSRPE